MSIIKNMRVPLKLWLIVLPAVLALASLLVFFIYRTNHIMDRSKTVLYDEVFVSTVLIINADRDFYQADVAEKKLVLDGTLLSKEKEALLAEFDENAAQVQERMTEAVANIKDNPALYSAFTHEATGLTMEAAYADFEKNFKDWQEAYDVKTGFGDYYGHERSFALARENINVMTELLESYALAEAERLNREVGADNMSSAAVISVVIVFILVLSLVIMAYLSRGIGYVTQISRRIAEGELSLTVDKKRLSRDELGQLCAATDRILVQLNAYVGYIDEITATLNTMSRGDMRIRLHRDYAGEFRPIREAFLGIADALGGTLSAIRTSAAQVNSGASAISGGAMQLAQGAEEQAAAVQQLSAVIEKVTQETADGAGKVSEAAGSMNRTQSQLRESTASMAAMLEAMNAISDTSDSIRTIIKLIDDIAFQTNILALNAAVEAARAGQYGKGFAVVAAEVKNLAARSADAAQKTSELIGSSITSVKEGIALAHSTADALAAVSDRIVDVNTMLGGINVLANSQAAAMEEIRTGIGQISTVVMSNSATAEESASASQELSSQAELLLAEVSRFQLSDSTAALPPPPPLLSK